MINKVCVAVLTGCGFIVFADYILNGYIRDKLRRPSAIGIGCTYPNQLARRVAVENPEEEDFKVDVRVVNLEVDTNGKAYGSPMHGPSALKFDNGELDDHYLWVVVLDKDDCSKYGASETFRIKANNYRKEWDIIPENALGVVTFKGCYTLKSIELFWDEKTETFETV